MASGAVFSKAMPARCLFCGAIGQGWWSCGCEWARKIADGKLPRPRTVFRNGRPVIECCDELRAAARLAGTIKVVDDPSNRIGQSAPLTAAVALESAPIGRSAPPAKVQSAPLSERDQKRQRILAQILLTPDASDRELADKLQVNRRTIAAIRSMVDKD